jgi:hypothetical protein
VSGYPERQLPDGRWLILTPLTFGRARLNVSRDQWIFEDGY